METDCVQAFSKIGQNRGIVVKFTRVAVTVGRAFLILSAYYLTFINVANQLSRSTFEGTLFPVALVALEVKDIRLKDI